jgi:putative sterol carrier protein
MTTGTASPLRFPSAEWCVAFQEAINANPEYRAAAKDWTHGPVAMVVVADPSIGLPEEVGVLLDVHEGTCRSARLVTRAEAEKAAFVLVGTYARWKEVVRKELDPTKGMMQNKLKLTKGHMPTMVKFVSSNKALVESTTKVPTRFLDE